MPEHPSRACFLLKVRKDRLAEYRRAHEAVWPEFLATLRNAGWRNYSTFLSEDGLVVGYFENEDPQRAVNAVAATEINRKWQSAMAEFFEPSGAEGLTLLPEVFNLDDQLRAAELPTRAESSAS